MSTGSQSPGASAPNSPALTVDVGELVRLLRRAEELGGYDFEAYTERYDWRKTDISTGVSQAVTASRQVLAGDVRALCGWSFRETTGAAIAALRLHDGAAATGETFVPINLAANESTRDFLVPYGIQCFTGRIFLEIVSGSVEGVLYWR